MICVVMCLISNLILQYSCCVGMMDPGKKPYGPGPHGPRPMGQARTLASKKEVKLIEEQITSPLSQHYMLRVLFEKDTQRNTMYFGCISAPRPLTWTPLVKQQKSAIWNMLKPLLRRKIKPIDYCLCPHLLYIWHV